MKEWPILFNGPMVRAVLARLKTQTRRIITRRNSLLDGGPCHKEVWGNLDFDNAWVDKGPSPAGNEGPYLKVPSLSGDTVHRVYSRWQVGDLLWVRETFTDSPDGVIYKANQENAGVIGPDDSYRWHPSIHMSKKYCRLFLEVTSVRVEQVQDIGIYDVQAEGLDIDGLVAGFEIESDGAADGCEYDKPDDFIQVAKSKFAELWDSINAKRKYIGGDMGKFPADFTPYFWKSNPWVRAIAFKIAGKDGAE